MRVAGPSLALSLLLFAAPALAQGGGYYEPGNLYNRQQTNQDRFDRYQYYPPRQEQTWQYPMNQGQWQPNNQSQWQPNYGQQAGQQWQTQPGSTQDMMQNHQRMMQQGMQGGYPPYQMGLLADGADGSVHARPGVVFNTKPDQELAGIERVQEHNGCAAVLSGSRDRAGRFPDPHATELQLPLWRRREPHRAGNVQQ